jgi:enterochelin esterase-like enzyme
MGAHRSRRPRVGVAGAVFGPVLIPLVVAATVLGSSACSDQRLDAAQRCRTGVGRDLRSRVDGRDVAVHLPPCYDARPRDRYPVVYLLHGSGADETMWTDLGADRRADDLERSRQIPPVILVQPDFGADPGAVIARRLVDRVVPWVDTHWRTVPDGAHRAVGGISLGASGALRAAAGRPGVFAGVGAVSPVLGGSTAAVVAGLGEQQLPVLVVVGSADPWRDRALALAERLRAAGARVRLVDRTGGHDRGFWSRQVDAGLRFYGALWP